MEMTKAEVKAIETVVEDAAKLEATLLTEMQLALVGGGIGDVVFG